MMHSQAMVICGAMLVYYNGLFHVHNLEICQHNTPLETPKAPYILADLLVTALPALARPLLLAMGPNIPSHVRYTFLY